MIPDRHFKGLGLRNSANTHLSIFFFGKLQLRNVCQASARETRLSRAQSGLDFGFFEITFNYEYFYSVIKRSISCLMVIRILNRVIIS